MDILQELKQSATLKGKQIVKILLLKTKISSKDQIEELGCNSVSRGLPSMHKVKFDPTV